MRLVETNSTYRGSDKDRFWSGGDSRDIPAGLQRMPRGKRAEDEERGGGKGNGGGGGSDHWTIKHNSEADPGRNLAHLASTTCCRTSMRYW